jgi:hypothetical protein
LIEIKDTGISIERFERIARQTGYVVLKKQHWLINPVYQYKFGWKPRKQFSMVSKLPFLRNFVTTGVFYALRPA